MSKDRVGVTETLAMRHASRGAKGGANNQGNPMWAVLNVFPLILLPVLIYNIWAFGATAPEGIDVRLQLINYAEPLLRVPMASGVEWNVTSGDAFILLSIVLLFVELLKSTSTGTAAIFNHALSMLVFIICLVEFLLAKQFATSTFFIIMIMALLDVLAGVVVTIISARRDVEFAGQH